MSQDVVVIIFMLLLSKTVYYTMFHNENTSRLLATNTFPSWSSSIGSTEAEQILSDNKVAE